MKKKVRERKLKKLTIEFAEETIKGLDKGVKILSEVSDDSKKVNKIKEWIVAKITDSDVMDSVAEMYKKHPEYYPNMIYLPHMIVSTINP